MFQVKPNVRQPKRRPIKNNVAPCARKKLNKRPITDRLEANKIVNSFYIGGLFGNLVLRGNYGSNNGYYCYFNHKSPSILYSLLKL